MPLSKLKNLSPHQKRILTALQRIDALLEKVFPAEGHGELSPLSPKERQQALQETAKQVEECMQESHADH